MEIFKTIRRCTEGGSNFLKKFSQAPFLTRSLEAASQQTSISVCQVEADTALATNRNLPVHLGNHHNKTPVESLKSADPTYKLLHNIFYSVHQLLLWNYIDET